VAGNPLKLGRPATYEDIEALPDHVVGEILGGDLYATPRPAFPHAHTASALNDDLGAFREPGGRGRGPGGWRILFEPELHFGHDVVVPDLAGWRLERMPVYPSTPYAELVPDWACEIASPSTVHVDRVQKMNLYAREGLAHLWLLDPLARVLEVYRLESGRWVVVLTSGGEGKVRAEPFGEVELDLALWWPPLAEPDGEKP
jgi:Uma2 family endonuclease